MYTGLVQEVGSVESVSRGDGFVKISVAASNNFLMGLKLGGSIAVNGVCLSATQVSEDKFWADITGVTSIITNLNAIQVNDRVNLERSAVHGSEVGGHLIAGHIDGTANVTKIIQIGESVELLIRVPDTLVNYIFAKGFLAINGASLTVASVEQKLNTIKINLIPETLRQTTFSSLRAGDQVNIEVDATSRVLVDTLERILAPVITKYVQQ
ncbi:MAG: riboflavin synthase subunit alpha [Ectopseudomonas guguanensis]|uniref:riboflavin synthase subunit alpha n=1 Tax=Ectopseudomonas guguanensis TaxID=1198456 RepID=UPI00391BA27F